VKVKELHRGGQIGEGGSYRAMGYGYYWCTGVLVVSCFMWGAALDRQL